MDVESSRGSHFQDSVIEMNKTPRIEANPDRLSELPESLQLQIISRLPIQDAIRTGALSTKWKDLWKHADDITVVFPIEIFWLDDEAFESDEVMVQKFIEAMNGTLAQLCCSNIKKLSLTMAYDDGFNTESLYDVLDVWIPQVLEKWIQWAYLRNVKDLTLELDYSGYRIPEWFCQNSSLEKMSIHGCVDIELLGGVVSWSSLKSLSLSSVDISEEDISKVLSGCPVLEILVLEDVSSITKLNIVSRSVKTLRLINEFRTNNSLSEVNAPWLGYLDIAGMFGYYIIRDFSGVIGYFVLQLANVSSLLKANLNLTYEGEFAVFEVDLFLGWASALLESVLHVEQLALGQNLIQALSVMKLLGKPCPLFRCKHLSVYIYTFKHEFPGIAYLFEISPCIETLVIKLEYFRSGLCWEDQVEEYIQGLCNDGAMYLSKQKVDFQYLKHVKILDTLCPHRRAAWYEVERFDFELAAYIMRNARSLEKLVITYEDKYCRACPGQHVSEYFSLLSRKFARCFPTRFEDGKCKATVKECSLEIKCTGCVASEGERRMQRNGESAL